METENQFEKVVLQDLDFPEELLHIFEEKQFDLSTLEKITKDELANVLSEEANDKGNQWNVGEIFRRLMFWRKTNGYKTFGFAEVIIEEKWSEPSQDPDLQLSQSDTGEYYELDVSADYKAIDFTVQSTSTQNTASINNNNTQKSEPFTSNAPSQSSSSSPSIEFETAVPSTSTKNTDTAFTKINSTNKNTQKPATSNNSSQSSTSPPSIESDPTKSPTRVYVAPNHFSPSVLVNLLRKTVVGQQILDRATHGPLSKESKRELVEIIADYHCDHGFPITEGFLRQYAEAITIQFKHEALDTYFVARGGIKRNHGGKLYNRISNLRQKAAKRKLNEEHHLAEVSKKQPEPPTVIEDACVEEAVIWLEQNSKPWGTVLDEWAASFKSRKHQLTKPNSGPHLLKRYQLYTTEFGYQLIDVDFRLLAVGNSEGIRKWNSVLPSLVEFLCRPYKDDLSKAITEHLSTSDLDQDSIICGVLILLNNELKPTKVTKKFKPSILAAQEDIIFFAETDEQAITKINEFETTYASYGFLSVPKLVFKGKNFRTLTGAYEVHYRGVIYQLDSAVRAIDTLVKLTTVFGLEYSKICRLVWNFISSFIYEISVAEQYDSINQIKRLLAPCTTV